MHILYTIILLDAIFLILTFKVRRGKTVQVLPDELDRLVLVNDPGYWSKEKEHFKGEAMTYYGRWTYKFEESGTNYKTAFEAAKKPGFKAFSLDMNVSIEANNTFKSSTSKNVIGKITGTGQSDE